MQFLLDTNICIYVLNRVDERLIKKIKQHSPFDFCISAISLAELEFGVANSKRPETNYKNLIEFIAPLNIISFDQHDARAYSTIKLFLKKAGNPIGHFDQLIAAQAINRSLTLVTNDNHFKRIQNLKVENWVK